MGMLNQRILNGCRCRERGIFRHNLIGSLWSRLDRQGTRRIGLVCEASDIRYTRFLRILGIRRLMFPFHLLCMREEGEVQVQSMGIVGLYVA